MGFFVFYWKVLLLVFLESNVTSCYWYFTTNPLSGKNLGEPKWCQSIKLHDSFRCISQGRSEWLTVFLACR